MSRWAAVHAAEEMLGTLGYEITEKAENPNNRRVFDKLVARIAAELAEATSDLDAGFAERLLSALDLDYEEMTAGEMGNLLARVARILPAPSRYMPRIRGVFASEMEVLALASRLGAVRGDKARSDFSAADRATLEALQAAQTAAIESTLGARNDAIAQRVQALIDRAINEGWRRGDVSRALEEIMGPGAVTARSTSYYDVVAGAMVGQARSFGTLTRYRDAGIERFIWSSVLDEVTTDICRFLHGTVFNVADGLAVYGRMTSNVDSHKEAAPWVRVGRDADGNKVLYTKSSDQHRRHIATVVRSGVGNRDDQGQYRTTYDAAKLASVGICLPPAHGRCRSTMVADV